MAFYINASTITSKKCYGLEFSKVYNKQIILKIIKKRRIKCQTAMLQEKSGQEAEDLKEEKPD